MGEKKLSIVIPCYNEANNIEKLLSMIVKSPIKNKEIIIIDDHSNDGTTDILNKLKNKYNFILIYHKTNMGKGAGIRDGLIAAKGDAVIVQDGDLEYDPNEYPRVIDPIFKGEYKAVYGSRFLNQKRKGRFINKLANWGLTVFGNICFKQKLTDLYTCYKAMDKETAKKIILKENSFAFEAEITGRISNLDIKIHEVPISYFPRAISEGKKIGLKDGFKAIRAIWKYRNSKKNHKITK